MGKLYIETAYENGKTVVKDSFFTSPFKITKPLQTGDMAEIMIMQASAGILEGDEHEIELKIHSGSRVAVTGQSYTKLFKMENGKARQNVKITVEKDGFLCYLPCPVIPFCESEFIGTNEIYLEKGARFVMQDIFACGRYGMGEKFGFRKYHSRTQVYENGKIVFADNTRLVPSEFDISGTGYFEGYTHQGLAYFYGFEKINAPDSDNVIAAVTQAKKGQLLRVLGNSSDETEQYLKNVIMEGQNNGI
jgi:urease accessory protein